MTTTVYMMAACRVVLLFQLVYVAYVYKTNAGTHVVLNLKFIILMKYCIVMWGESLKSDGQEVNQYQQTEHNAWKSSRGLRQTQE